MLEFNATFIVSIISFIIFILIMNDIFYKPIIKVINDRKSFIDGNYNDAKDSKEQAETILTQKDERLHQTLNETKKIVSDKVNQANETAQSLTGKAKENSQNSIDDAKTNIHKEEIQTTEALKENVKDLAESISSKILGQNSKIDNVDYDFINKVLK